MQLHELLFQLCHNFSTSVLIESSMHEPPVNPRNCVIPSAHWFSKFVHLNKVLQENKLMFIVGLLLRANNNRHASIFRSKIYK